jgi:methylthioribose-1-phosphate isomerase
MVVRGAPLIGATAAYGLCLALRRDPGDASRAAARARLLATRPTAVNLRWALDRIEAAAAPCPPAARAAAAYARAAALCDEDVAVNAAIGAHGLVLLEELFRRKGGRGRLDVLTHCNAGWLATVDGGTALAPVYRAHDAGLPIHVWVDETRPRQQGAALTAWELAAHGVPHTLIVDGAAAHLMQRGRVDACLVGTDRTTRRGDVCNKIGTYAKALAARAHGIPFYVAVPTSSIDLALDDGLAIPIEERSPDEVRLARGRSPEGHAATVALAPPDTPAANPAFDVTPAALVTALITERGVCEASAEGVARVGNQP